MVFKEQFPGIHSVPYLQYFVSFTVRRSCSVSTGSFLVLKLVLIFSLRDTCGAEFPVTFLLVFPLLRMHLIRTGHRISVRNSLWRNSTNCTQLYIGHTWSRKCTHRERDYCGRFTTSREGQSTWIRAQVEVKARRRCIPDVRLRELVLSHDARVPDPPGPGGTGPPPDLWVMVPWRVPLPKVYRCCLNELTGISDLVSTSSRVAPRASPALFLHGTCTGRPTLMPTPCYSSP